MCFKSKAALLSATALLAYVHANTATSQTPPSWSEPVTPFLVFGNTYYVGSKGLSAILVTSLDGHVLIDGDLPTSPKLIAANVRTLGFRMRDIKLILNSHVHFDHAGGIAALQKMSGAEVAASPASATVLESGVVGRDDPQYGKLPSIARVRNVRVVHDGEAVKVGKLELTAHFTPGHTPGGTSWSWRACEQARCVDVVYADSLNPISAPGYRYADPSRHPNGEQMLRHSYEVITALPCDILLTPHPELSATFAKLAAREQATRGDPFIDPNSCKDYVAASRKKLRQRLKEEKAGVTAPQ